MIRGKRSTEWVSVPMQAPMSGTTAGSVSSSDATPRQELRERVTLIGFVIVAIVATVAWLGLLAWLGLGVLRSLGV